MSERPRTPRERAREQTLERITEIGSRHLAEQGAAALSLRAVARELGVVSSAVYRYVASRDDLLTLLVVDGYRRLGDRVDAAVADVGASPPLDRCRVIAETFRQWGLDEPARYGLIFGTPVPGYRAPRDTVTDGTRVVVALLEALADGVADGSIAATGPDPDPAVVAQLDRIRADELTAAAVGLPDAVLARAVALWGQLVGVVGLEVFGWYGADSFTDPGALFDDALELHLSGLHAG